jgi:hypothetical protein
VENAPKVLSAHRDYGNYRLVLFTQSRLRIRQKKALKEYKRILRIRQEYLAVYGEYANRHKSEPFSANFRPNPEKILVLNHLTGHDRMGKKPTHPLNRVKR